MSFPMDDNPRTDHAYRVPGHQGSGPNALETDVEEGSRRTAEAVHDVGTAATGQTAQVPVNAVEPMEGTSETSPPVDGVRIPRKD